MNEKTDENLQKSDMVYGVPCTCGNLATIATRDSGTHKSTYWCGCDRRYVRDDRTGEVVPIDITASSSRPQEILSNRIVILPPDLAAHYSTRSAATGKGVSALVIEDLNRSFKQWKRAQSRQESKIFRQNEYERL